jgi:hypothetical protein
VFFQSLDSSPSQHSQISQPPAMAWLRPFAAARPHSHLPRLLPLEWLRLLCVCVCVCVCVFVCVRAYALESIPLRLHRSSCPRVRVIP